MSDKYVLLYKAPHEIDWEMFDSLEEVANYLAGELVPIKYFKLFKIEKEIEIKLNEVPFKGLSNV